MGSFTTAVSVPSVSELWSFPTRSLTKKFGIIERISPSFSSTLSRVYRAKRYLPSNITIKLFFSGNFASILTETDNLISTDNVTRLDSNFTGLSAVLDFDDSTYGYSAGTGIPTYSEVHELLVNLGSTRSGILVIMFLNGLSNFYTRVYTSIDGSSWTRIIDNSSTNPTTIVMQILNVRYLRVSVYNGTGNDYVLDSGKWRLYTLEFYDQVSKTELNGDNSLKNISVFVNNCHYQLIELIEI